MRTFDETKQRVSKTSLVSALKNMFTSVSAQIPEEYYYLMADYYLTIESSPEFFNVDIAEAFSYLPEMLTSIIEEDLGGIYGETNNNTIIMNSKSDYQTKKKYFFHELSHVLQTRMVNGKEECSYSNGRNGMFLAEATAQIVGEITYAVSNGEPVDKRKQKDSVQGQPDREVNTISSLYQYNESVLRMLSCTTGIPFNDMVSNGFKKEGRDILQKSFESLDGNMGSFDLFMDELEKIYYIEKIGWKNGHREMSSDKPVLIKTPDGRSFNGNFNIQRQIKDKIERKLISDFIMNHTPEYILDNYEEMYKSLTTLELKSSFNQIMKTVSEEFMNQDESFGM